MSIVSPSLLTLAKMYSWFLSLIGRCIPRLGFWTSSDLSIHLLYISQITFLRVPSSWNIKWEDMSSLPWFDWQFHYPVIRGLSASSEFMMLSNVSSAAGKPTQTVFPFKAKQRQAIKWEFSEWVEDQVFNGLDPEIFVSLIQVFY